MNVCRRALFSGHVQGVGFRATARALAQRHQLRGSVRNLADGRVELIAEGAAPQVERFLEAVRQAMEGYIEGMTLTDETPREFADFRIER